MGHPHQRGRLSYSWHPPLDEESHHQDTLVYFTSYSGTKLPRYSRERFKEALEAVHKYVCRVGNKAPKKTITERFRENRLPHNI